MKIHWPRIFGYIGLPLATWVAILTLLLVLGGCSRQFPTPPNANITTGPEAIIAAPPSSLAEARERLAQAEAAAAAALEKKAQAEAMVAALEKQAAAERRENQRRLLAWASGLALLGALACVALAIWSPVAKKSLWAAALACVGVLAAAQVLGHLLTWLPAIGLIVSLSALVAAGVALAIRLRASVASTAAVIATTKIAEDKIDPVWREMRQQLISLQGGPTSPVQRDLDRMAKESQK